MKEKGEWGLSESLKSLSFEHNVASFWAKMMSQSATMYGWVHLAAHKRFTDEVKNNELEAGDMTYKEKALVALAIKMTLEVCFDHFVPVEDDGGRT